MSKYRWIRQNGKKYLAVGIEENGSLFNPNNYPEEELRAALIQTEANAHLRRSEASKRSAITRRKREEKKIHQYVKLMLEDQEIPYTTHCYICGRYLQEEESRVRAIGPECLQNLYRVAEAVQS